MAYFEEQVKELPGSQSHLDDWIWVAGDNRHPPINPLSRVLDTLQVDEV